MAFLLLFSCLLFETFRRITAFLFSRTQPPKFLWCTGVFRQINWEGLFMEFLWAPKRDPETSSSDLLAVWLCFCDLGFWQFSYLYWNIALLILSKSKRSTLQVLVQGHAHTSVTECYNLENIEKSFIEYIFLSRKHMSVFFEDFKFSAIFLPMNFFISFLFSFLILKAILNS